jgi:hypothetical protein
MNIYSGTYLVIGQRSALETPCLRENCLIDSGHIDRQTLASLLTWCYKSRCNSLPPGLERRSVASRYSRSIPNATQSPLANWRRLLILALPSSSPVPVGALASYILHPLFDMFSPLMLVSFFLYVFLFNLSRSSRWDHRSDSLLLVTV